MIDRAVVTADLAYRYIELFNDVGIVVEDTPTGVGPILDEVDQLSYVNPSLTDDVLMNVARYKALDVIVGKLAPNISISDAEGSYQANQEYSNAKALRDSYYTMIGWALVATPTETEIGGTEPGTIITVSSPTDVGPWWEQL